MVDDVVERLAGVDLRARLEAVAGELAVAGSLQQREQPEELADAVLFFASPWARSVTGQNLMVDGGLVMN